MKNWLRVGLVLCACVKAAPPPPPPPRVAEVTWEQHVPQWAQQQLEAWRRGERQPPGAVMDPVHDGFDGRAFLTDAGTYLLMDKDKNGGYEGVVVRERGCVLSFSDLDGDVRADNLGCQCGDEHWTMLGDMLIRRVFEGKDWAVTTWPVNERGVVSGPPVQSREPAVMR